MESSAHLVAHFVDFTLIVSMSQMRHLTAGNNTVLQEADDDHCCTEVSGALSTSVKDADFL